MKHSNLSIRKFVFFPILVIFCFITNGVLAQRDAGGTNDGTGGVPTQPCPTSFTRNNGDGSCNGEAQIRLYYTTPPIVAPTLVNILYEGEPLFTNGLPVVGNLADYATKGYIGICLPTSNIPPAIKLTLVMYYAGSSQPECVISGTQ
jgi:hypothetical protein